MCHIAYIKYFTHVSYIVYIIYCMNIRKDSSTQFMHTMYVTYRTCVMYHMCYDVMVCHHMISHVLWCHGVSSHVWRTQRRSWVLFGALVIVQMILKILHIYRERRKRHLWWHHHICTSYRNDILYDRKGEQLPPAIASSYLER